MQIHTLNPRLIKLIIASTIICFGAWLLYYLGTHGRIVVTNQVDDSITITPLNNPDDALIPTDISNGGLVKSGVYTALNADKGQVRLARVEVGGWLSATTITYGDIKTAHVARKAALTYENFLPIDDSSFASFTDIDGYASRYATHPADDPFGGKSDETTLAIDLTSPVVIPNGTVLGFTENNLSSYTFTDKRYNPITPIETEVSPDVDTFPVLSRSSDIDSSSAIVLEGEKNTIKIIDTANVTTISVPEVGSRGGMVDVNNAGWIYATNSSEIENKSGTNEDEETKLPYTITFGTKRSSSTTSIDIGRASYLSGVALSPDGKYVAASRDGYVWVYDTESKKPIIANPATNTTQLMWRGTKLYTLSADLGVMVFDTTTNQILPISLSASENLSFSKAIPIGNTLYVTAYTAQQDSKLPDGYMIDLMTPSDGLTEALVKKLPISTEEYDISYLNSTIYIRTRNVTASPSEIEATKKAAQKRLEEAVPASIIQRCKVVYTF